jgi:hypothetical protein
MSAVPAHLVGDLVVADQHPGRSAPGAQQGDVHAAAVHRGHGGVRVDGQTAGLLACPAQEGVQPRLRRERRVRLLGPHVDDHPRTILSMLSNV